MVNSVNSGSGLGSGFQFVGAGPDSDSKKVESVQLYRRDDSVFPVEVAPEFRVDHAEQSLLSVLVNGIVNSVSFCRTKYFCQMGRFW